jgi:Protein of unknown function (DUF3592)
VGDFFGEDLFGGAFGIVFGVVAAVIGVGMLTVGSTVVRRMRQARVVRARAVPVRAVVVGSRSAVERDMDGDRRSVVRTTVRFEDRNEVAHEVEFPLANAFRGQAPGSEVDVLYDPQDPTTVLLPSGGSEIAAGVLGGFFAVLGVGVLVVAALVLSVALGLGGGDDVPGDVELPGVVDAP